MPELWQSGGFKHPIDGHIFASSSSLERKKSATTNSVYYIYTMHGGCQYDLTGNYIRVIVEVELCVTTVNIFVCSFGIKLIVIIQHQ